MCSPPNDPASSGTAAPPAALEEAARVLEVVRWSFLEPVEPSPSPEVDEGAEPARLDARLRELTAQRERWESLLGHLSLLARLLGLWRDMQFASFGQYVRERLGLGLRSVEQRIALERRLYELPSLRAALASGRLDAERARLVAQVATEQTEAAWIERAARTPCVALRLFADQVSDPRPAR